MEKKIYSSFEQIDADLEILSIEQQINYQKVLLAFQSIRRGFTPSGVFGNFFDGFRSIFSGSYSTYYKLAIPLILKWFVNRKRSR